jgi:hypothetical protein
LLVAFAAAALPAGAGAEPSAVERVSAGPIGGNGAYSAYLAGGSLDDGGIPSGVSEDGSRVYVMTNEQLTGDDTDAAWDLYLRSSGATTLVSDDSSAAADPNVPASYVGVSRDGTSAFFTTGEQLPTDSGPADADSSTDLYVRDGGVLRLVSVGDVNGNGAFDDVRLGGASDNGDYAVFSTAEALTADDTDSKTDVYGRALGPGSTERLSKGADSASGNGAYDASFTAPGVFHTGMAEDGSRVFFHTGEQLLAEDTDASQDVYERLPGSATTNRVSRGDAAGSGNGAVAATFAGSSLDGTRVFFHTFESLDAVTDTDSVQDVYERSGGSTAHVSRGSINGNGATHAYFGAASEDGSHVFFTTAESLEPTDTDAAGDIYDRSGGATTHVSQGAINGNQPYGAYLAGGLQFTVSADGSHVFFMTDEALSTADTDSVADIYERFGTTTTLLSDGVGAIDPAVAPYFAGASADGSKVGIVTSQRLTSTDLDSCPAPGTAFDAYLRTGGVTLLASVGPLNDGVPDHACIGIDYLSGGGMSRDGTVAFFHTGEGLRADDTDGQEDVYRLGVSDAISQSVPSGGGNVSTGSTPTSTDPVETSVYSPSSGVVTISEIAPSVPEPAGYTFLGYQVRITAPAAPSADNPLVFTFGIDSSLLPPGYDESAPGCGQSPSQCLEIFRNGVSVAPCVTPGNASPSPCVDARSQPGGAGTDLELTVLATAASDWNFGLPEGTLVVTKDSGPDDPQDFSFTTDGGLAPPTFSLDDDADGTLSDTQTFAGVAPGSGYSISEADPGPDWYLGSATCDDGSPVSDIDVSPGETVTCAFVNSRNYPRPGGGTPLRVPLVPAYEECAPAAQDSNHIAPLDLDSCSDPQLSSSRLTTSTVGRQSAWARYAVIPGDIGTPADEADVAIDASATDVRLQSDGSDYVGPAILRTLIRVTDRANSPGGVSSATVKDAEFSFPVSCAATPDPNFGGTCSLSTTADTLLGEFAKEGKRAVISALSVELLDAGGDGSIGPPAGTCPPTCGSGDERVYLRQGVFVP